MLEFNLAQRIYKLRKQKGVSAREMSLDLGQNENYINMIENKKTLPSMRTFYYICEYLNVSPKEFFDTEPKYPEELNDIISDLKCLSSSQLKALHSIIKEMKNKS